MRIQRLSYFTAALASLSTALASSSNGDVPPKNIVFGVTFGGSSHVNWVLSIMNETASRGHNVTFAARNDFTRYSAPYENIKTVQIGHKPADEEEKKSVWSSSDMITFSGLLMDIRTPMYAADFLAFKALLRETNADVVVCDHFTESCEDAARVLNIPFIITCSMAASPDARVPYVEKTLFTLNEPTSLTMSFPLRFYNRFIAPLYLMSTLRDPIRRSTEARNQVGAPAFSYDPWKDSLKMINSAFGFEPARPLGPLVELVGPIVQPAPTSPLPAHLQAYLDAHARVVYVAFGQNYAPTRAGLELILSALLDNVAQGTIDGFLWATVISDMRVLPTSVLLPSSGRRQNITAILEGHDPHCCFVERVPQQAVLRHPAVAAFLTHAGKASLYESLLAGMRMVAYPLLGDQPFNARTLVRTGLGTSFDRHASPAEASTAVEQAVKDVTGEMQANVERYGHLVRVRSKAGAAKGADLVEEVAVMHKGGKLPHRYEAARQMSFVKATNLDLYAALVVVVVGVLYVGWRGMTGMTGVYRRVEKSKVL